MEYIAGGSAASMMVFSEALSILTARDALNKRYCAFMKQKAEIIGHDDQHQRLKLQKDMTLQLPSACFSTVTIQHWYNRSNRLLQFCTFN